MATHCETCTCERYGRCHLCGSPRMVTTRLEPRDPSGLSSSASSLTAILHCRANATHDVEESYARKLGLVGAG